MQSSVVHIDSEILGGTPVFAGTRVPVKALWDYLEAGQPLAEFLDDFPSVTREQAVAALEEAKRHLETGAAAADPRHYALADEAIEAHDTGKCTEL
jgi:uncharacterized protein (DUF433 family)